MLKRAEQILEEQKRERERLHNDLNNKPRTRQNIKKVAVAGMKILDTEEDILKRRKKILNKEIIKKVKKI